MPPITYIEEFLPSRPSREAKPPGLPSYYRVTVENSRGAWPGLNPNNCAGQFNPFVAGHSLISGDIGRFGPDCWQPNVKDMDPYGAPTRWIEISSSGPKDVTFTVESNVTWATPSIAGGIVKKGGAEDIRIEVSIDWDQLEMKDARYNLAGGITIRGSDHTNVTVGIPVTIPPATGSPSDFHGFIEGDGYVAMEARNFVANHSVEGYAWEEHEWYGRTVSGLSILPVSRQNFTLGEGPSLSYDFWSTGAANTKTVEVTVQIGPSMNFLYGKHLAVGIGLDEEKQMFTPIPDSVDLEHAGTVPPDWLDIVAHEIRNVTGTFEISGEGKHTVTIWGMTAGIVVERVWVDFGGIKERGYSYLGPPESRKV